MFGAARALHCLHQRVSPAPIGVGNPLNRKRARDRRLQLFSVNEEFLVLASHQLALITSLPFVHTARRYYRLSARVKFPDRGQQLDYQPLTVGSYLNPAT